MLLSSVISLSVVKITGNCMINAIKSFKISYSAMVREVESDPESVPRPDHHQKLISSSDWQARSQYQVSVKSADYFCSDPAHRMTERQTE